MRRRYGDRGGVTQLLIDRRGTQHVEYLILIGLVALGALGAFRTFGRITSSEAEAQGDRVANLDGSGGPPVPVSGPTTDPGEVRTAFDDLRDATQAMSDFFGFASGANALRSGGERTAGELRDPGSRGRFSGAIGVRAESTNIVTAPIPVGGLGTQVMLIAQQTVTAYVEGRAGEPRILSIGGRVFAGLTTTFTVTAPEDVAARMASGDLVITPFDPATIPAGTSIMLRSEDYAGTSLEATFRGLAVGSTYATQSGIAIGVTRLSDDRVRVVVGPTEAVSGGLSVGLNLGVVGATFGSTTMLRDEQLRVVDFDLSTEAGRESYQALLLTGELPARDPAAGVVRTGGSMVVDVSTMGGLEAHVGVGPRVLEIGGQSLYSEATITETRFDDGTTEYVFQGIRPGSGEAIYLTETVDDAGQSTGVSMLYGYANLDGGTATYFSDAFTYPSETGEKPPSAVEISLSPEDVPVMIAQAREWASLMNPDMSPEELQAWLEHEADYGPGLFSSFNAELALATDTGSVAHAFANNSPGAVASGLLLISLDTGRRVPGTFGSRPVP